MKISGYMVYPKQKVGVSLLQGGLLYQRKRNQSEQTVAALAVLTPCEGARTALSGLPRPLTTAGQSTRHSRPARLVHIIPIEIPIILFPNSHLFPSLFPIFSSLFPMNIHILVSGQVAAECSNFHL